ncbi:MAG: YraN family protein [Candidatus Paceibacterota bacterium]
MANIRQNRKSNNKLTGNKGEDISCKFLVNKGFIIVDRNYRKVWGEIDIIAQKDNILHFFEVKSVTVQSFHDLGNDTRRPEDNVHGLKIRHIRRMVETYLDENHIGLEIEFRFHVICVYLNMANRMAKLRMIENIIL